MVNMISKATSEDNVYVTDFPARLRVYAEHDTRVLKKCLKRGIESEFTHLNIPRWKRGDESKILELISAKDSGFLVLEGDTECVNPYTDWAKWDEIHENYKRDSVKIEKIQTPPQPDTSPLEPHTPSVFEFPEQQVISADRQFSSPRAEDFDTPTQSSVPRVQWGWPGCNEWGYGRTSDAHNEWVRNLEQAPAISPELYCSDGCDQVWYECTCVRD